MTDDRRERLENIRLHQIDRLRHDAAEDAADRPDTEARIELARTEDGIVRAPTRAEIVVALWRGVLLAVVASASAAPLVSGLGSSIPLIQRAIAVGGTIGATLFIADMVWKTRARHVEHVRVRVFQRHDYEPYVLALVTLGMATILAIGAIWI